MADFLVGFFIVVAIFGYTLKKAASKFDASGLKALYDAFNKKK